MDSLNIRVLNETDYQEILVGWWKDWGMEPPNKEFLPDEGSGGIMVLDDDMPVCAGFMYATNSKVAWVDWIVSNKKYRKKPNRRVAIALLLDTLTNAAKNAGFSYSYALVKNNDLVRHYVNVGYTETCEYTNELIKKL